MVDNALSVKLRVPMNKQKTRLQKALAFTKTRYDALRRQDFISFLTRYALTSNELFCFNFLHKAQILSKHQPNLFCCLTTEIYLYNGEQLVFQPHDARAAVNSRNNFESTARLIIQVNRKGHLFSLLRLTVT